VFGVCLVLLRLLVEDVLVRVGEAAGCEGFGGRVLRDDGFGHPLS